MKIVKKTRYALERGGDIRGRLASNHQVTRSISSVDGNAQHTCQDAGRTQQVSEEIAGLASEQQRLVAQFVV